MTSTIKAPRKAPAGKKPFLPRSSSPSGSGAVVLARSGGPIEGLVIGGEPRVHLLPPQVLARKKGRAFRRKLGVGLVAVIVLVALGVGLATVSLAASQAALLTAQQQSSSILQQQAKYGDVLKVKADAVTIQTGQKQATTQEISWQPFINSFEATLPADASITSITASIDSPFAVAPVITDPLQGPRVATVAATLSMSQSEIAGWLNSLPALKGFVDVTPNSVTLGTGNAYVVSITLHLSKDALANRFTKDAGGTK
jgi:Tfp pilus assembly protein PilN